MMPTESKQKRTVHMLIMLVFLRSNLNFARVLEAGTP